MVIQLSKVLSLYHNIFAKKVINYSIARLVDHPDLSGRSWVRCNIRVQ
jgi:hypothetical protein